MSDAFIVKFLQSGMNALLKGGAALFGQNIDSFLIGDAAGFTPTGNETAQQGNLTFTGTRDTTKVKEDDAAGSFTVSMIIPEQYDQVSIGNVVLFVRNNGVLTPFVIIVFPEVLIKQNVSVDIFEQNFPYPGTRMVIGLVAQYVDLSTADVSVTVSVQPPNYANLPLFGDETQVPTGGANPWAQFILNRLSIVGGAPTLVTKDADNDYYASPLFQNIDSPKYGVLDGWGDNTVRSRWVWGRRFNTDSQLYSDNVVGGAGFLDTGDTYVVGGAAFVTT